MTAERPGHLWRNWSCPLVRTLLLVAGLLIDITIVLAFATNLQELKWFEDVLLSRGHAPGSVTTHQ